MRVVVFGAGAIGSLLGALLAATHEVVLVGRAAHMDAVRRDGLRVEGVRTLHVRPRTLTSLDGQAAADLLLLTVKAYDTEAAIAALRAARATPGIVASLQNGLGNYEALREAFPGQRVLAATVTYGAMLAAPGRVVYAGAGDILVGGTPHDLGTAGTVARALRDVGLRALGVPDIRGPLWQKAIVNASINPLSAVTGKTNGELLEDPELVERMGRIAAEGAAVARALKVALPEKDPFVVAQRIARATAGNRSSMLQDVERGRRTEVEQISGVIVREGDRLGIPTPENRAALEAVRARERRR